MDLTDADVTDILALLDSLPYDELDLETSRFRLTLRRTPHGWTQSTQVLSAPALMETTAMEHRGRYSDSNVPSVPPDAGAAQGSGEISGAEEAGGALVAVRAPLPGTFYRAPRPGAAPFVDVGSRVSADTVIGIVETMKLMNSVHAGTTGRVAEIRVGNGEFAALGATLMLIEPGA